MKLSPIILFSYNRPHYLLKTLQSLKANKEAKESTLYIYCDGPKPDANETTREANRRGTSYCTTGRLVVIVK